jgi:CRP/FNR family transcriptional regulator, cyclic AMP receptor protein
MRKVLFLLGQLNDEDLEWLITTGERRDIAAGTVVIEEGKSIDALYILLDGTFAVTGKQFGSEEIRLGSGEVVGEISLLDSRPTTARVTAATHCVALAVPRDELVAKLGRNDGFSARFYHALAVFLAHRLRNTYKLLGYGAEQELDEDVDYEDELSAEVLDTVHMAGSRFDRALRRLLAE